MDNIERIGDPKWRGYFSQYKHVERSGELQQLIDIVEEKLKDGTLHEIRDRLNTNLRVYGYHVTLFANKV